MIKHLKKLLKVLIPSLIAIALIMIYGKYRCDHKDFKDPLETKLILGLDGWSMTHVTFFGILGYMYPEYFWYALFWGIIWELFEHFYGIYGEKFKDLLWDKTKEGEFHKQLVIIINGRTYRGDNYLQTQIKNGDDISFLYVYFGG